MVTSDYEIVIAGEISADYAAQFAACELRVADGRTNMLAHDIDQAALYGLIERAASLGLTLLDVHRCPTPPPSPTPGDR